MSSYLADTNVVLRWMRTSQSLHTLVRDALDTLQRAGHRVCVTPQNLIECWNVATRPADKNGFGLTPAEADREIAPVEKLFYLLPDSAAIYPEWRQLVVRYGVSGVQVHDARLVAAMNVHGVTHLLTLNEADFRRYSPITAVHPRQIARQPPGS